MWTQGSSECLVLVLQNELLSLAVPCLPHVCHYLYKGELKSHPSSTQRAAEATTTWWEQCFSWMPVDGTAFISANYIGSQRWSVLFLLLILAVPHSPLTQMWRCLCWCACNWGSWIRYGRCWACQHCGAVGNHDGEEEIRTVCLGECGSREAKFNIVVVWLPKCIPASAVFP